MHLKCNSRMGRSSCSGSAGTGRMSSDDVTALRKGPADAAGTLVRLSDRPSLCISARGAEVAVGSSDHAVYIVNVEKGKFVRALYGKQWGHTEWVTCVEVMEDGRILSGGMDSKLCLWEKNVVRCTNLVGHTSSISGCTTFSNGSLALSSSYDKTMKVWDLMAGHGKRPCCVATLKGHRDAVTTFALHACPSHVVSGSRAGEVILWDGGAGKRLACAPGAHKGQVTAVESLSEGEQLEAGDVFISGGQDGVLQVWDFRAQGAVQTVRPFNKCPVAFLKKSSCALLVAAGGDASLKVLDPRASFQTLHTMHEHKDNIFCLYVHAGLAWSGDADGKVLVHQIGTGECLYGLGAVAKGAVRCLCLAGDNKLAVAGDDGNVLIYSH